MYASELNFEKFAQEASEYANELADKLDHPNEKQRAMIAWKAVMHTVRDRIEIAESFHLISQLPLILKGVYTEGWKYSDKPLLDYKTIDEMNREVKILQERYGERDFDWNMPTEEITSRVLDSLVKYVDSGQLTHVRDQMPKELQELV
ncbi:MAG: DUF2267 domain-containing protein [Brumimicrobium sp.]|nr:DUF2267 domain-containing protein [Brumimicrobium sp.]